MDAKNREIFRDLVIEAMARKSWSATKTAEMAGISQTTMTRVTRAESVTAGTVGKLRHVLEITSLSSSQNEFGFDPDVKLVMDSIGYWLQGTPPESRAMKVAHLFGAIANSK